MRYEKLFRVKRLAQTVLFLAILVAIPIGYLMWDTYKQMKFYDPMEKITDVRSFVQHFGPPVRMYSLSHSGKPYYLLYPEDRRIWISGHPAYLFDLRGQLMDWTPDDGDAPFRISGYGSYKFEHEISDSKADLDRLMQKQSASKH